ncbi:hypothetical protein L7F22_037947 [Adiantum nelumboides]|nr:hypothetical protein [Adiantum nelumboides]
MIQEHKIAQPFGNLMRAGFRTFWEPAMGPSSRSCSVCISVGPRLLFSVRHHSTLIAGRALYVAIDIEDTLVGFLSVYAPNTPRERAIFWSQLADTLPIVNTWIIGGDFNNLESDSDRCVETRPILSSISPHEQDEWDRFRLATHTADAWHIPSFGRSQGSLKLLGTFLYLVGVRDLSVFLGDFVVRLDFLRGWIDFMSVLGLPLVEVPPPFG